MWWQSITFSECVISAHYLITSATGIFLGTALYVSSNTHSKPYNLQCTCTNNSIPYCYKLTYTLAFLCFMINCFMQHLLTGQTLDGRHISPYDCEGTFGSDLGSIVWYQLLAMVVHREQYIHQITRYTCRFQPTCLIDRFWVYSLYWIWINSAHISSFSTQWCGKWRQFIVHDLVCVQGANAQLQYHISCIDTIRTKNFRVSYFSSPTWR